MNITTFPIIETERLTLRKIEESDSNAILFLLSDKTINKFSKRPEDRGKINISDTIKHIQKINKETENNQSIAWGIALKDSKGIIGTICLWNFSENYKNAEIGYNLKPTFQRKGFMSEALNAVIEFGFAELKIARIVAYTHNQNERSKKLLARNGFDFIGRREDDDSDVVFEIRNS